MSNHWFRFKQFVVNQDRCAMKVGTDSVLLGAWCNTENREHVLDIGTGTGILSLMIAQRNGNARITAIDIDGDSIAQAKENVEQSQFKGRIEVMEADFNAFTAMHKFDLIVSNPPFYEEKVFCPDDQRNNARHTTSLDFTNLIKHTAGHLAPNGVFSVIIPTAAVSGFISICAENKLYLSRRTDIHTTPKKQPKRTMLEFSNMQTETVETKLFMRNEDSTLTDEYITLTKDFYL